MCYMIREWSNLLATFVYGMLGLVAWTSSVTDGQTHGQAVTPAPGEGTVLTMGLLVPHSGSRSLGNVVETTMKIAIKKVRRCSCKVMKHIVTYTCSSNTIFTP